MKISVLLLICIALMGCEEINKPIKQWSVATEGLYSAKLSQDAERLLITSYTHGASFWNTKKYQRLFNWNHAQGLFTPLFFSAISRDQKTAITADSQDFVVWDTLTGKSLGFWSAGDDILSIDMDAKGTLAAVSTENHKVTIFDLKLGTIISQIVLPAKAELIKMTDSARYVITAGSGQKVKAWDVISKQSKYEITFDKRIDYISINETADLMLVQAFRQDAAIHQLSTGKFISTLSNKNDAITFAEFDDNGKRLIIGTSTNKIEQWQPILSKKIKIWQLPKQSSSQFSTDSVLDIKEINNHYLAISTDGYLYLL
ncbi:WD40 repeat domain-containing protein [Marinicellulosiphila megalodicopiae]|uniref:WD40 repeat domain-containing protein n=1 Tax=Marinicellulosiphila megalodicopiae TaxID=2724896 RepID=UPI003BB16CB1